LDTNPKDRLIVALDVSSIEDARALVKRIGNAAGFYKIGYQLAFSGGLALTRELVDQGKKVFLDLKLHDIPNTVEKGTEAVAKLGATFLTVHAYRPTLAAAVRGRGASALKILAVTVLTSWNQTDVEEAGYRASLADLVCRRALDARAAKTDGVIVSAREASLVRAAVGRDPLIVTPGIRPAGAELDDQKRAVTPAEAIQQGADYVVVGRPITGARNPFDATRAIQDELAITVA
jgi:orotidine-5'-phosphate decarboxylase